MIASIVGLVLAALGVLLVPCPGAPARSKPWRSQRIASSAEAMPSARLAVEAEKASALRQRSHVLRIHVPEDPRHLHPLVEPTVWGRRIVMGTVVETLLRYQPGRGAGPGTLEPALARSYRVAPREIRLELEDGVRFHDGKTMTAVDVQFSIDAARHPRSGAEHHRRALSSVSAVQILGPRSVRIQLERQDGYVLRELAEIPILPAHAYPSGRMKKSVAVIGTGPYRIESADDTGVTLARDPAYWGEAPAIEKVVFVREPDAAAALTAAKEGRLDVIPELIPEHYPEQADAPGFAGRFKALRLRPAALRMAVMETGAPPFDDARVRRAVSAAIDREALVAKSGGLSRAVAGPIWPGGPGDGASAALPAFDAGEAPRLLDAAGYRDDDGDGTRERGGKRLMITVLVTSADDPVRDAVLDALRGTGFALDVRVGSPAVLQNRLRDGAFDLAFVSWRSNADRDLSPLLGSRGRQNFGKFSDARVDALLGELARAWQPSARAPIMAELAARLAETMPVVPLLAEDPYGLVHRRVRGLEVWDGWFSIPALSLADDSE